VNDRVCRLVQEHGAWGIVCRRQLEVPREERANIPLSDQLTAILSRNTWRPQDEAERFWVLPEGSEIPLVNDMADDRLLRAIRRIFDRKSDLNEHQWMILRYYAEGLPKEAIVHYIEKEYDVAGDRAVERLQDKLRPAYRRRGPDLRSAAEDLFSEFPAKRRVPDEDLDFRTMGRFSSFLQLQIAPLEQAGYLDNEARDVFWKVFTAYSEHRPSNASGDHVHQQVLERILRELAGDDKSELRRMRRALVRAVNNLYDTEAAAPDE